MYVNASCKFSYVLQIWYVISIFYKISKIYVNIYVNNYSSFTGKYINPFIQLHSNNFARNVFNKEGYICVDSIKNFASRLIITDLSHNFQINHNYISKLEQILIFSKNKRN